MIREKIEELRRQLEYHNFRYYVENAPEISDFEFDTMMRELIWNGRTPNCPTPIRPRCVSEATSRRSSGA